DAVEVFARHIGQLDADRDQPVVDVELGERGIQIADGGDAQRLGDGGGGDAKAGGLIGAGGDLHLGAGQGAFGGEAGQCRLAAQRGFKCHDGGIEVFVIRGQHRIGNVAVAPVVQFQRADV